jgi:RNA-splicing ligase RtcB
MRRNGCIAITGNCGMYVIELGRTFIDLKELDEVIHKNIPCGRDVHDSGMFRLPDLIDLICYRELKDSSRFNKAIGTLGGGNHFLELNKDDEGNYYLVIHSGSRNLGKQVADYYQELAIQSCKGLGDINEVKANVIQKLKEEGRRSEIQKTLSSIESEFKKTQPKYPDDLCFLTGQQRQDYLHDMQICQRYAIMNREKMAELILGKFSYNTFHTVHNYVNFEDNIIRKGAISAKKGEKVIIPINMRDGSILGTGLGNEDWNNSAPHGAGRLMSRSEAKRSLSMSDFTKEMSGVYTTTVSERTLDEAPMAYKPMKEILDNITDTVSLDKIIKPVYNFKAGE